MTDDTDLIESARAFVESRRDREFRTIFITEPTFANEGDRITVKMIDGSTYSGTVQSCDQVDAFGFNLIAVRWDTA